MSKIFKVIAAGDTLHFGAIDQADASAQLTAMCGAIPPAMLTWEELAELPVGEELAPDMR